MTVTAESNSGLVEKSNAKDKMGNVAFVVSPVSEGPFHVTSSLTPPTIPDTIVRMSMSPGTSMAVLGVVDTPGVPGPAAVIAYTCAW